MSPALRSTPPLSVQPVCDAPADLGFTYQVQKNGSVQILRDGRTAMTVGGRDAARLLNKLDNADGRELQLLLARASGQFKFGNEKVAKDKRSGR